MATPTLTRHRLESPSGPLFVEIRTGTRTAPAPAVVIVPGFDQAADWGFSPVLAERLARAGFTVAACPTSGAGEGATGELATVLAALRAGDLGLPSPTSLGLAGYARAGGVAILEAGRRPEIGALVTWAARATDETVDLVSIAARVRAPWLIVHGREDEVVACREAVRLAEANPAAERLLLDAAGHTFGTSHPLTSRPPALERALDATTRFFSQHLP